MFRSREEVWEQLRAEYLPRLKTTVRKNLEDIFLNAKTWRDIDERLRDRSEPRTLDEAIAEAATMYALGHTMRHAFVSYEIGKACRYLLLALLFLLANAWYLTHTAHPTDQVLRISGILTKLVWASGILSGLILLWAGVEYWVLSRAIAVTWDLFRELIAERVQDGLPHARATRDDA